MTGADHEMPTIDDQESAQKRLLIFGGSQYQADGKGLLYDVVDLDTHAHERLSPVQVRALGGEVTDMSRAGHQADRFTRPFKNN